MSQDEYIAILFIDTGFDGPARRAWLQLNYGHRYSDELTAAEKHDVIERLKVIKENGRPPAPVEDDEC